MRQAEEFVAPQLFGKYWEIFVSDLQKSGARQESNYIDPERSMKFKLHFCFCFYQYHISALENTDFIWFC